jgi:predicted dehydrogenase
MNLKWGVIGAGSVAQRRAMPAINKAINAELHALMSRDEVRAKQLAETHGASKYYTSVEDLISDTELDAVYISTPVYMHCEPTIEAAENGLHIMCDKPMAMNVNECQRMIDACSSNGVQLQICFLFRFHSAFQQIKGWITEGRLGRVVQARMPFIKYVPKLPGDWHIDPSKSGGGSLIDLGVHSIDLFEYLIGEVVEVSAFCNSVIHNYDVDETAMLMMRFKNGGQAVTETSFTAVGSDQILEIYGTDGSVVVFNDDGWKVKTVVDGHRQVIGSQYEDLFQLQFEHFARCVSGDEQPIVSGYDGLQNMKIVTAAYESAENKKVVFV